MVPDSRGFIWRWVAVALGAWLLAGPVLAAKPDACKAHCAGSLSKETQDCMKKCPSPDNKARRGDYQACAQACTTHFNRAYKKCTKGCGAADAAEDHDHGSSPKGE
jgi:hypothetical protein